MDSKVVVVTQDDFDKLHVWVVHELSFQLNLLFLAQLLAAQPLHLDLSLPSDQYLLLKGQNIVLLPVALVALLEIVARLESHLLGHAHCRHARACLCGGRIVSACGDGIARCSCRGRGSLRARAGSDRTLVGFERGVCDCSCQLWRRSHLVSCCGGRCRGFWCRSRRNRRFVRSGRDLKIGCDGHASGSDGGSCSRSGASTLANSGLERLQCRVRRLDRLLLSLARSDRICRGFRGCHRRRRAGACLCSFSIGLERGICHRQRCDCRRRS